MAEEIRVTPGSDGRPLDAVPASRLPAEPEPSLGELFRELATESSTLIRQEIKLAKMELTQAATRAALDATWLSVWTVVALLGGLALTAAAVIGLGILIGSYWLSALIIGGVLVLLGGLAAWGYFKKLTKIDYSLQTTRETLQSDARWAQDEAAQAKRELTS